MTTLLVDGDQYIHRVCAANERDVKWDYENHVLMANEEEAWDTLQAAVGNLRTHFGNADVVICLGQAPYFRHQLFPGYKPGRGRKPMCFPEIRQRLKDEYQSVEFEGLEADDVMGILATKPGNDAIIVARDKDMKGVPAKVWDGKEFANYGEAEADYFHLFQTLTGDTTDGYKGCPGVGPVKAEKLLMSTDLLTRDTRKLWSVVSRAYVDAGLTEADALLQARLARILRWSDWNNKKKVPILWTP